MSIKRSIVNTLQNRKVRDSASMHNSQAFCMKPWVHLFVSHFGTVVPCCLTPWEKEQALGDINEKTVEQIWNDDKMKAFRLDMLKDKPRKECWQCYENEKAGLRSTRKTTNFMFDHKIDWALDTAMDGSVAEAKPITWDIRVSNLCNFKCRICGHHSSSQWYEDAKALGLLSHDVRLHRGPKDFDKLLKQLEFVLPELEEIYFAGGEPLIMEEHYRILNRLLELGRTNVRLCYATNFSQMSYKGQHVVDLWAKFEEVHVFASLDGSGKRGEFQRKGQLWEQVIANRNRMKEVCPNVEFLVTSTISVFNVLHLPDFHREWTEAGLMQIDEFMPHTLKNPVEYNICLLPTAMKLQVEENINKHINWIIEYVKQHPLPPVDAKKLEKVKDTIDHIKAPEVTGYVKLDIIINEFRSCITLMNSRDDAHLIPEFQKVSKELDQLRGEDTKATFPELDPLFAAL